MDSGAESAMAWLIAAPLRHLHLQVEELLVLVPVHGLFVCVEFSRPLARVLGMAKNHLEVVHGVHGCE